jgi:hypothetical protein
MSRWHDTGMQERTEEMFRPWVKDLLADIASGASQNELADILRKILVSAYRLGYEGHEPGPWGC